MVLRYWGERRAYAEGFAALVDRSASGMRTDVLAATRLCPRDPAAWRELAGVRFLQSRWTEASASAERAARLDPGDEQGWNLLATSQLLDDQTDAALEAWNRIGRPSVDLVRVDGPRRTRDPVIAALVDLPRRTLLIANGLGRAARRLQDLPSAARTSLRYRPIEGGRAAFADTASAWRPIGDEDRGHWHTDVGAGIRLALPGNGGTMRVDVARGLRDRRVAPSAGWQAPWPGR